MTINSDWREDEESFGIALKLQETYPDLFAGLDLSKIRFVRNLAGKGQKAGEIKSCQFPFNIDSPYAYYLVIENARWKQLADSQKNLLVMHFLYSIAEGGTDETSKNYTKCRKHDVKDFNVVLAAAGGRYDWMEIGVGGLADPLAEPVSERKD